MQVLLSIIVGVVMAVSSSQLGAVEEKPDTAVVSQQTEKLNINTASPEALESLPGIGEKKAAAIISYRDKHGSFQSIEQLQEVKGIGSATLASLRTKVRLKR